MDGQFALAAYDARENRVLLARDRMGISPLFWGLVGDYLVFASEMKAIFATGLVRPEMDPRALDSVALLGTVPAPRAAFRGLRSLAPGHFLEAKGGTVSEHVFWDIPYGDAGQYARRPVAAWAEEFREVLTRAARRRLKADVPVGLYLSGGIDSATVAAMTADAGDLRKHVFSIGLEEPGLDESRKARAAADFLGIEMQLLRYTARQLGEDLPRLLYHAETPLISTESVALMALAGLAARHVKVVLTGEGADECLGGYTYFRWEALKARLGHGLLRRAFLGCMRPVFAYSLGARNPFAPPPEDEAHAVELFGYYPAIYTKFFWMRWIRDLVYSDAMLQRLRGLSDLEFLDLPRDKMRRWDVLNRTMYLSSRVFMASHLLGPHGDRALMAHSIEGRYPFLDRRVQEFLATVPPSIKTRWRSEKYLLRRMMRGRLPKELVRRRKQPFLTPFGTQFVGDRVAERVREVLRPERLREFGYFDPAKVERLAARLAQIKATYMNDPSEMLRFRRSVVERTVLGMAMNFVVTAQVLADQVQGGEFYCPAAPARREAVRPAAHRSSD
jgi:asparagine synthase (glutamine-hydrolysing)